MPEVNGITDTGTLYSPVVGFIYMFNLIVGTGALTMPKAFQEAGWLISVVVIVVLCFMSYLTSTYVIEAMASSNALLRWKKLQRMKKVSDIDEQGLLSDEQIFRDLEQSETSPLLSSMTNSVNVKRGDVRSINYYDITERTEMGQMVTIFFNRFGKNLFYVCIAIYLYGDLAIYSAAVPKSLRDVACTYTGNKSTHTLSENAKCWQSVDISRYNAYRIFVTAFTLVLGPFTFFNVQKMKYLQILTTLFRWFAFLLMIVLAVMKLASPGGQEGHPPVAEVSAMPNLFGVCIYSFMCHHSLPSLVTPISNKRRLYYLVAADYLLILLFYSLLSFTAIFTFATIDDLYTLNFEPSTGESHPVTRIAAFQYFLALFPVFTLSTNFPIIAITLRNNLKTLFYRGEGRHFPWLLDRVGFPLMTILPPIAVAFATHDLEFLVGITGSYAGAAIQYVFPAFLVFYSRRDIRQTIGRIIRNPHASPFQNPSWCYFVLLWAVACVLFVTTNHITTGK